MKKILKILIPILIIGSLIYYFQNKSKTSSKNELLKNEKVNTDYRNKKSTNTNSYQQGSVLDTIEKKKNIKKKKLIKKEIKNKEFKRIKSKDTVLHHDDYIEIFQTFKGNGNEIISKEYYLDLKNYPFLSLSAYILPKKSNITLFYRYFNEKKWSDWKLLPEDKEIYNNKRTVFGLINIQDDIEIIQFKSNTQIEKVVFNIFTPKN